MAKTKKHEMTKEELRAPDELQVALEGFWQKLVKYKKPLLIGLVAIVGVGVTIWIIGISNRSSENSRGIAQRDAATPIGVPVGPKPTPPEGTPPPEKTPGVPEQLRYPDEAARLAAADASLSKFLSDRSGDDAAELVGLAAANNKLAQGKVDEAASAIDAWLGKYAQSPARSLALELKGRILLQKGDKAGAAATLTEAAGLVGGPLKASLLERVGDLQNPAFNGGQGDGAKAKAAYDEAMAALPPALPDADPQSGPRADLEVKKAQIP